MMTTLKLAGMRTAYDDILADGLKRRHPVQQIIGALLKAEIADKTARSIKYQMASAKLPAARELAEFDFAASPVNEPLIRDLAMGGFLEARRNIVLVGGTGTGKTHLAVAIARSCIRKGARGRFYNVVDLVSRARDRAELVTDNAAELRAQLQAVTGERTAALEGIGEMKREASGKAAEAAPTRELKPERGMGPGNGKAREETKTPAKEPETPVRDRGKGGMDLGL